MSDIILRGKNNKGGEINFKKKKKEIKSIKSYKLSSVTLISIIMNFYENLK